MDLPSPQMQNSSHSSFLSYLPHFLSLGFWNPPFLQKKKKKRFTACEFPGGLVVRITEFHSHGPGSIPGQGTEISQAVRRGQKRRGKIKNLLALSYVWLVRDNKKYGQTPCQWARLWS